MLSKNHADYGAHCGKGVNLAQKSKPKQSLAQAKVFGENTDTFKKSLTTAQSWAKNYTSADEIPDHLIPESYSFENIDGYNFMGPIRDQGACGSCYTVSFTQVVESRLKLKYGTENPELSP